MKKIVEWMRQGWRERGIDFALDVIGCVAVTGGFAMAAWILAH